MFNTSNTIMPLGLAMAVSTTALGDMTGLSYDIVGEDLISGTYTVRLYANVEAGDTLTAVFGNSEFDLNIQYLNGSTAYQNALGGPTSMSIHTDAMPSNPSLEWDSFVTVGALNSTGNELYEVGIDWASWEAGGNLFSNDGTWFALPTSGQGESVNGRVLIAQLTQVHTSYYDVYFSAGFQWVDASGVTHQSGHSISIIPAPSAIAMLGLAGLAGQRRRRRIA